MNNEWLSPYRQTGRTTRMLQSAAEKAKAGDYVLVLAADLAHQKDLQRAFVELVNPDPQRCSDGKVYVGDEGGSVSFAVADTRAIDQPWPRPLRVHKSVNTFIDHHAIERQFMPVLTEWHRFNADPAE